MVLEEVPGELLIAVGAIIGALLTGGIELVRDYLSIERQRSRLRRRLWSEMEATSTGVLLNLIATSPEMAPGYLEAMTRSYDTHIDDIGLLTEEEIGYVTKYYTDLSTSILLAGEDIRDDTSPVNVESLKEDLESSKDDAQEALDDHMGDPN